MATTHFLLRQAIYSCDMQQNSQPQVLHKETFAAALSSPLKHQRKVEEFRGGKGQKNRISSKLAK